jgi:hypothetical protein
MIIEQMIAAGDLQRVSASREHADRLLGQARRHVSSTQNAAAVDPEGAYAFVVRRARKTLTAILDNQGLRPTSRGGNLAVYHAVARSSTHPWVRHCCRSTACDADDTTSSTRLRVRSSLRLRTSPLTCRRLPRSWDWPSECSTRCVRFEPAAPEGERRSTADGGHIWAGRGHLTKRPPRP